MIWYLIDISEELQFCICILSVICSMAFLFFTYVIDVGVLEQEKVRGYRVFKYRFFALSIIFAVIASLIPNSFEYEMFSPVYFANIRTNIVLLFAHIAITCGLHGYAMTISEQNIKEDCIFLFLSLFFMFATLLIPSKHFLMSM